MGPPYSNTGASIVSPESQRRRLPSGMSKNRSGRSLSGNLTGPGISTMRYYSSSG